MNYRATSSGTASLGAALFFIALFLACAVGWVWNVVKMIGDLNGPLTAMVIARIAGIPIVPLGVVLGYL